MFTPDTFCQAWRAAAHCILIVLLCAPLAQAEEDIYVSKEKDQYSEPRDESLLDLALDLDLDRYSVQINLASYHTNRSRSYNEFNPGIGLEYAYEHFYLAGGYFRNSIRRSSFYAGAGGELNFPEHIPEWIGVGVLAGLVTGYKEGQKPQLAAIPYVYFRKDQYTFKAHYFPEVGRVEDDAIGFALRIDLY